MRSQKIFWRLKGSKTWQTGWLIDEVDGKIRIGDYIGDTLGKRYLNAEDVEIEKIDERFE